MLVLSRRTDEKIVIGQDIHVTVLRIDGNRVKLGITCNRNIPVVRKETASGQDNLSEKDSFHASNSCQPARSFGTQAEFHMR